MYIVQAPYSAISSKSQFTKIFFFTTHWRSIEKQKSVSLQFKYTSIVKQHHKFVVNFRQIVVVVACGYSKQ